MAINRLAQSNPAANTPTLLHTSTRNALVSIIATNTSSAADVTMWTVPNGAGSANYVYHASNTPLPGNNTLETFRFAIESGDEFNYNSYHVISDDSQVQGSFFGETDQSRAVFTKIPDFELTIPKWV